MDVGSMLDEVLCFFYELFEHVCWLLCFQAFIDFGALKLQNAASYLGKTVNCLKFPFLNTLKILLFLDPFWHRFVICFMMFVSLFH